jgi:Fasciclin domain
VPKKNNAGQIFGKKAEMFRKMSLVWVFAAFALLTTTVFGQAAAGNTAYLRFIQLANDGAAVSVTLQDGRTVLTSFAPDSFTDYLSYEVNRSTLITFTVTPTGGSSFQKEWAVPPLTPGHHSAALVGSSRDNTLQLIFIDEDTLCAGKLAAGSCVILVNSIRNSPPLRVQANSISVLDTAGYRQAVIGGVAAGTYLEFTAADQNDPQSVIFHSHLHFFEPNVIYIYGLIGSYPGRTSADYTLRTIRRVPVDSMTFLRGLTAKLQLTDTQTLFATENIVAILEQSGFDQLLSNSRLPLTVFVPTDEAVVRIAGDLYQCALSDPAAMRALILNHILVGAYTPAQLVSAGQFSTMAGSVHTFQAAAGGFLIDNTVSVPDSLSYPTSTGNVYLIDTVLIPPGFADQYCTAG